jgi:hypothetical protein
MLMLIFPMLYTFVMIYIFSASEQRYVAPLYPFFVLFAGYFISKYLPAYWLHKIQGAKNID